MAAAAEIPVWFDAETDEQPHPEHGPIAIDTEQLTFEGDSAEVTVPLSAVMDVRVEHVPPALGPIPPGEVPITLVYDDADCVTAATVAAEGDVIRPFTMHVLETLLTGEPIRVKHPARIDQERTPASFTRGTLTPTDGVVHFGTDHDEKLDMSNITSIERTLSDSELPHLVRISFVDQGLQCQTAVQLANEQTVSIFGRYLNIHMQLDAS